MTTADDDTAPDDDDDTAPDDDDDLERDVDDHRFGDGLLYDDVFDDDGQLLKPLPDRREFRPQ